jgi:hypothetical protein
MTSATVTKLDVQAGHPEHDRLIDNVNKVRDRVTDLFDGHGPNEAIDIAQAMAIFIGNIIGKARAYGFVDEEGMQVIRNGVVYNLDQAMEGSREHVCDECRGHTVN